MPPATDVARHARYDPSHGRLEVDGSEQGRFAASRHADDGDRDAGGKLGTHQLEGRPEVFEGDPRQGGG